MSNYIQKDSRMKDAWHLFIQKGILKREIIPDKIVYSWVRCRLKNLDPEGVALKITLRQDVENIQRSRLSEIVAIQKIMADVFGDSPYYFITLDHLVLYSSNSFEDWIFEGIEYSELYHGTNALDLAIDSKQVEMIVGHEHYKKKLHGFSSACFPLLTRGLYLNLIAPLNQYDSIVEQFEVLIEKLQTLDEGKTPVEPKTVEMMRGPMVNLGEAKVVTDSVQYNPFLCIYQRMGNTIHPLSKVHPQAFYELENSKPFMLRSKQALEKNEKSFLYPFEDEILVVLCDSNEDQSYIGVSRSDYLLQAANQWMGHKALYTLDDIQGKSDVIKMTIFNAKKAASHHAPFLIIGERGTGKSAIAQAIHQGSTRSKGPFIALDCESTPLRALESLIFGNIHENGIGALELSKGGTLYIDHIEAMPNPLQKRILKEMEKQSELIQQSTRFIFSSCDDLKLYVQQGVIREDLYHRIGLFTLVLPPVRDRKEDLKVLTLWLIRELATLYNIPEPLVDDSFLDALEDFPWYGNARELQQVLQDIMIQHRSVPIIKSSHLMQKMNGHVTVKQMQQFNLEQLERETIKAAIEETNSNMSKAAELLGIGRTTLYRKIEKYGFVL